MSENANESANVIVESWETVVREVTFEMRAVRGPGNVYEYGAPFAETLEDGATEEIVTERGLLLRSSKPEEGQFCDGCEEEMPIFIRSVVDNEIEIAECPACFVANDSIGKIEFGPVAKGAYANV